jgi:8-oxo-dGTP diphosphatase
VSDRRVVVSAAVVERDSRFLVTRRLRGTHLEGFWEFPGGKCEPDESPAACLVREIREELGCGAIVGERLLTVSHDYGDRTIELHFFRCALSADPQPLLGQEMQWVAQRELGNLPFPPADDELIRMLSAP